MRNREVLFISHSESKNLLSISDAIRICEEALLEQARGSVVWSAPPSLRMDAGSPFHNHWQVKGATMTERRVSGMRLYDYIDDGFRNNVGSLARLGYVLLSDVETAEPLAIIDDHWNYAIRSVASPGALLKFLAPTHPKVLALVGVGMMGEQALRCFSTLYAFDEIRCTSRRPETRERFARLWGETLGLEIVPCDSVAETVSSADIVVGGTTSSEIMCHENWLKPGSLFISLARREFDPAGWSQMDKVVVDSWDFNMRMPMFREMVERGQFSRERLHGEFYEIAAGLRPGRANDSERILVHTCGLASQDIALAHHVYLKALESGRGVRLPVAGEADSG